MDTIFVALAVVVALSAIGLSAFTYGHLLALRRELQQDREARAAALETLTDLCERFTGEHNKLVGQVADIGDRLMGQELRTSGAFGKAPVLPKRNN